MKNAEVFLVNNFKFDPKRERKASETHILLAEDGLVHVRILQAVLVRDGYTFSWLSDGLEAYEAIKGGFRPSLLITDVKMPGISGFELMTRLKQENLLPPTLVLTAVQEEEEVLRGLQLGAMDYVKKPISPAVISAKVRLILSLHKTSMQSA